MSPPRGERLLPAVVDELAASDPDRVMYSFTKTANPADGFHDVTARALARAVDRCAWFLEEQLGKAVNFPTITYLGHQDLIYPLLLLAAAKTGYRLLLTSPRERLEAHLSLLQETDCHVFLMPPVFPLPVVKQILDSRPMKVVKVPGVMHWLDDTPVPPYPYTKTFAEAKAEPLVVLHTSGSTGTPKPIVQTHGTQAVQDAFVELPSLGHKPVFPVMCAGKRLYLTFPLFHCAGLTVAIPAAIYAGITIVLGPFPPSAAVVNAVHLHGNVDESCIVPMTLVELVQEPEYVENLSRVERVTYGGGSLPAAVGELINSKTRLLNVLGTTEAGALPSQASQDAADWEYMSVSPVLGAEYRLTSDGLYEQVIVRDPKLERYQGIFHTFPDLQEWPMKDLYSKHPTREGEWLYRGRADDIVVFSTGEKMHPVAAEQILSAHALVEGVVVAGTGRFQACVLIEVSNPPTNPTDREALLDEIWPAIQAANKENPSHGVIHRSMVLFAKAEKPLPRAGKGTVLRKMALSLYAEEMDTLYAGANNSGAKEGGEDLYATGSVEEVVRRIVASSTEMDVDAVAPDANLFELGMDSLQVTLIVREVNKALAVRGSTHALIAKTVYANPTLGGIIAAVEAHLRGDISSLDTRIEDEMQHLYDQYVALIPSSTPKPHTETSDSFTVLLTGSTGSLGSYILHALLHDRRITHIFCLNRGPSSLTRQQTSLASKGLSPLPSSRVTCLDATLQEPNFGLDTTTYTTLLTSVNLIIHNAWHVDFNLALPSFTPHLAAITNLTSFCIAAAHSPRLFFTSSLSTVVGLSGAVPERVLSAWSTPEPTGYGASKFLAERLLDVAARKAGVRAVVCRVGQVAGPTGEKGEWPRREWLPSLLASAKTLGVLPEKLGQLERVDWIPVDVLGRIIVELATSPLPVNEHGGARVYHAANPHATTWTALLPTLTAHLAASPLPTVPLTEWVQRLRHHTADTDKNPAVKLLDFFAGLASADRAPTELQTTLSSGASESLRQVAPVDGTLMQHWLRQWAF